MAASDALPRFSDDFGADKRFHPAPITEQVIGHARKTTARLIYRNGLVEDPVRAHQELQHVNPWTPEEKEIFLNRCVSFSHLFFPFLLQSPASPLPPLA